MSRRKWIILAIALLVLAVGVEVAVRFARGSRGNVRVVNAGAEPIEGLVVSFAGTKVTVGRVSPGETAEVRLEGDAPGPIGLEFAQRDNPLNSLRVEDYDPREASREGLRTTLEIRPGEVSKYLDEGEPTAASRFRDSVLRWLGLEPALRR